MLIGRRLFNLPSGFFVEAKRADAGKHSKKPGTVAYNDISGLVYAQV